MTKTILLMLAVAVSMPLAAEPFSERDLETARDLRDRAIEGDGGFGIVADLTTRIGPRMPGSEADARAVAWAEELLNDIGFDRVWLEPVTFPAWKRHGQRVAVSAPGVLEQELVALALGFSPSTPAEGIEAEVVMFDDLEALEEAEPDQVAGRIVFIRNRMERTRDGSGYRPAVQARSRGSLVAAEKGAVGLVIRSIGTSDNRIAHTGGMRVGEGDDPLVPAVAISNPDADQLERIMALDGPAKIHMEVEAETIEEATSHNVIAEITGDKHPEKIVALGAHLDSWDVGTGAVDDGAGIAIITEAGRLILDLDRRPDRSIHLIFFAAEEVGLWGGRAWAEKRRDRMENYQLGAESDFGAGRVYEIGARVADEAWPVVEAIQGELEPLGIELGGREAFGGPDFIPALEHGLAVVDLSQDGTEYFDLHHTENDTLDKIDPEDLSQNAAAYAVLAWLAAQSPVDFGSGPKLVEADGE